MPTTLAVMFAALLSGVPFGLYAVASPGPFQAYLISQTLKNGWKKTLPAVFAPVVSDGPIILLMVVILTNMPDLALLLIQILGGVFLMFLAWRTLQAFRNFDLLVEIDQNASRQNLWEAALVNASSPGPWIFWSLVTGPLLVNAWRSSPVQAVAFLAGFYGTLLLGLALFIFILGNARRLGSGFNRALLGLSAILLGFFGAYQILSGIGLMN